MSRPHLLAYFCSDFSDTDVSALRAVAQQLGVAHSWVSTPPAFVRQFDDDRVIGIGFELTEQHENLAEPLRFIDALSNFSRTHAVDFEFEADHARIGTIENGIVEHTIEQGLLNGWS